VVKLGAVAFIVNLDSQYAINLQLVGGVIILQTLPAVALALYTRWFHHWGLIAGWATGLVWGLSLLDSTSNDPTATEALNLVSPQLGTLSILGWEPFAGSPVKIYVGLVALVGNLVVAALVTIVLRQPKVSEYLGVSEYKDETEPEDYHADEGSPRLKPLGGDA